MSDTSSSIIDEFIDRVIQKEKESFRINTSEMKRTVNAGLRTLLLSMMDIEKEHVRILMELHRKPYLTQLFSESNKLKLENLDSLFQNVHFGSGMDYLDFLTMLILREEQMSQIYNWLNEAAVSSEIKFLFKTLEDDNRKKRSWSLDRYELEIISGNF